MDNTKPKTAQPTDAAPQGSYDAIQAQAARDRKKGRASTAEGTAKKS